MKKIIKLKKYIAQETDCEITWPEVTTYWFITGQRIAYKLIPEWTTWNKEREGSEEEIYGFSVISVNRPYMEIKRHSVIGISEMGIILRNENSSLYRLFDIVTNEIEGYSRTKEQFDEDYNNVLTRINELI